jgi:hypothetical protein
MTTVITSATVHNIEVEKTSTTLNDRNSFHQLVDAL